MLTKLHVLIGAKGVTAETAALEMGIDPSELSRIANHKRKPSQRSIRALEAYFQHGISSLLTPLTLDN